VPAATTWLPMLLCWVCRTQAHIKGYRSDRRLLCDGLHAHRTIESPAGSWIDVTHVVGVRPVALRSAA
jgi:hypothetical protein